MYIWDMFLLKTYMLCEVQISLDIHPVFYLAALHAFHSKCIFIK